MARNQNMLCVVFLCILNFNEVTGKIYSRKLNEKPLFQKPHLVAGSYEKFYREKRSAESNTTSATEKPVSLHSENSTLTTTVFALHGVNDNEAFVHWTGEKNNVGTV